MSPQDTAELVQSVHEIASKGVTEPSNVLIIASLILGVVASVLIRLRKLKKNPNFNYGDFFEQDAIILGINFCVCFVLFISRQSIQELKVFSIMLSNWMYLVSFLSAMISDITVDKFVSGYEQYLDKKIDKKINE